MEVQKALLTLSLPLNPLGAITPVPLQAHKHAANFHFKISFEVTKCKPSHVLFQLSVYFLISQMWYEDRLIGGMFARRRPAFTPVNSRLCVIQLRCELQATLTHSRGEGEKKDGRERPLLLFSASSQYPCDQYS